MPAWRCMRYVSLLSLLLVVPFLTNCDCGPTDLGNRTTLDAIPKALSYDAVGGQKQERVLVLKATGGIVGINKISIERGGSVYKIKTDLKLPKELAPGKSLSIRVEYSAPEGGAVQGLLVVESDAAAPSSGKLEVRLLAKVNQPHLVFTPNPVNFDQVEGGKSKTVTVKVENRSDAVLEIPDIKFEDLSKSKAFTFPEGQPKPQTLQPNASFTFKVTYKPVNRTGDRARLTFGCKEKCLRDQYLLDLEGALAAPIIEVSPVKLDFGFVAVGKSKTLTVKVSNKGKAELVLSQVAPKAGTSGAFVVPFLTNIKIKSGESRTLGVQFRPVNGTSHQGTMEIKNNDPTRPLVTIPLSGKVTAPDIEVTPKQINFGKAGVKVKRILSIANVGNQPLVVKDIVLVQGTSPEFQVVKPQGGFPFTLQGNGFKAIEVTYTPANQGADSGKLAVISNDPDEPRVEVPLTADGSAIPECDLQPVPRTLNFGLSVLGKTKTIPVRWSNQGSVDCKVTRLDITLRASFPPYTGPNPFTLPTPPAACKVSAPDRWDCSPALVVKPAQVLTLDVSFSPLVEKQATPISSPSFDGTLTLSTNGNPANRIVTLTGLATKSCVQVVPDKLDFGLVTVNCSSRKEKVTIFNTCKTNLTVSKIGFAGGTANGFRITSAQQVPFVIPTGQSADVVLQYRSTPPPKRATAVLEIEHSVKQLSPISVPLIAQGTTKSDQTDNFVQSKNPKIDILFVVDDSCSMSDNQNDLGRNFKSFIQLAKTFNVDFQIGVTTTDVSTTGPPIGGGSRFTPGELRGSPKIMTKNTPNLETIFQQNVKVGTGGSAREAGLEAAKLALSHPLITTGKNKGFLRKDASLSVIAISDEPDQSPQPVQFYINFFRNIKGVRNVDLFRFSAVVGYDPATKRNRCSKPGSSAGATSNGRYVGVANGTRGVAASICKDWANTLRQLGALSFGLRSQFFLTRPADPKSVKVKVNGQSVPSSEWSYDAQSNSVVFNKPPAAGTTTSVNYRAICF